MSKEKIHIFDTTLRDGAQTEGVDFSIEDKNKIAKPASIKNGSIAKFTAFHPEAAELPAQFINPPEAREATVTPPKTIKSFNPCALNFSSSLQVRVSKLVPEINKKFHPNPKNINANI